MEWCLVFESEIEWNEYCVWRMESMLYGMVVRDVGFEWNGCKSFSDFLEATLIGNGWISFSDLDPRLDLNKCRIMDASVCNDGFSISEIVSAWHNGEMQACGHLNGGACEICKDRL